MKLFTKWRSGGLSPAGTHKDRLDSSWPWLGPDLVASSTLCHAMFNCYFVGESCCFFSSSSFRICCFTMIRMVIWNRISPGDLPDASNRQQSSQTKTARKIRDVFHDFPRIIRWFHWFPKNFPCLVQSCHSYPVEHPKERPGWARAQPWAIAGAFPRHWSRGTVERCSNS